LGSERDPDKLGYRNKDTLAARVGYLLCIGPLRARFAPVDVSFALDALSSERRAQHYRRLRSESLLILAVQLCLALSCGRYYAVYAAALITANVLSNVREMAEHSWNGAAAHVDIRPSPLGLMVFSTPGFWFHGVHHMDPGVHYLDLPRAAQQTRPKGHLPYLQRDSAVRYLLRGH
jgi:hypothetical protein